MGRKSVEAEEEFKMDSLDAACVALNLTDEQCAIIREAAEELCKEKRQKGKREPSPYQEFIAKCMLDKKIQRFEEASTAMKECAKKWQSEKEKVGLR
jgi:hypothetical protein